MAYDADRQAVVLFGGFAGQSTVLGDTWTWDGSNWAPAHPTGSPAPGNYLPMVFDNALGGVLLLDDRQTWLWDGANWRQIATLHSPTSEVGFTWAAAYDRSRNLVVLFGPSGTWTFDGVDWVHRSSATGPQARVGVGLTYDAGRKQVVLFGGAATELPVRLFNDLWAWDGANWLELDSGSQAGPTIRDFPLFVYDGCTEHLFLFGGSNEAGTLYSDTWTWDAGSWTRLQPQTSPPSRYLFMSTFDATRKVPVLFGGGGDLNDTWVWDGANWVRKG